MVVRTIASLVLVATVFACGASQGSAPVGPTSGTCGEGCTRSCEARCSGELAQCEARCDASTPMELGNTMKQASVPRDGNPSCRRNCSGDEQTCLRTCGAACRPCE
ncbi:MAG: hypothetical protein U0235_01790 [Polyangiaceae bacterium]